MRSGKPLLRAPTKRHPCFTSFRNCRARWLDGLGLDCDCLQFRIPPHDTVHLFDRVTACRSTLWDSWCSCILSDCRSTIRDFRPIIRIAFRLKLPRACILESGLPKPDAAYRPVRPGIESRVGVALPTVCFASIAAIGIGEVAAPCR